MKKVMVILLFSILLTPSLFAQIEAKNYIYVQRDTVSLSMDIYYPEIAKENVQGFRGSNRININITIY